MKKIMFSDKYGLTKAVLEGRKTQTRRIVKDVDLLQYLNELEDDGDLKGIRAGIVAQENALYKIGEIVAIAQAYKDILQTPENINRLFNTCQTIGWCNKMFVKAELMPHHIRITDVRIERLQDISHEDCIAEGIKYEGRDDECPFNEYSFDSIDYSFVYDTAKEAYSELIDKISGKGTWESNPYVFVYEFELID